MGKKLELDLNELSDEEIRMYLKLKEKAEVKEEEEEVIEEKKKEAEEKTKKKVKKKKRRKYTPKSAREDIVRLKLEGKSAFEIAEYIEGKYDIEYDEQRVYRTTSYMRKKGIWDKLVKKVKEVKEKKKKKVDIHKKKDTERELFPEEAKLELAKLYQTDMKGEEIAERLNEKFDLGYTKEDVWQKKYYLDNDTNEWKKLVKKVKNIRTSGTVTQEDRQKIVEMWDKGMSKEEIKNELEKDNIYLTKHEIYNKYYYEKNKEKIWGVTEEKEQEVDKTEKSEEEKAEAEAITTVLPKQDKDNPYLELKNDYLDKIMDVFDIDEESATSKISIHFFMADRDYDEAKELLEEEIKKKEEEKEKQRKAERPFPQFEKFSEEKNGIIKNLAKKIVETDEGLKYQLEGKMLGIDRYKEWIRFCRNFLDNSGKISAHFEVKNNFYLANFGGEKGIGIAFKSHSLS